jgi:hypothetical protein
VLTFINTKFDSFKRGQNERFNLFPNSMRQGHIDLGDDIAGGGVRARPNTVCRNQRY